MHRRTGFVPILIATLGASCTIGCALDSAGLYAHAFTDGGASDADADGGVRDDAAPPDANLPDSGPFDADLPDAGDSDAGEDAGLDAGPDDAGTDAGSDAGTDAGISPIGCADGVVEQPYIGHPDMVGCDGAADQCTAETLCGAGWHLCTYTEFVARGGDGITASERRWIASCARLPGTCTVPTRPTDAICGGVCIHRDVGFAHMGAVCGGSSIDEPDCPLGVATYMLPTGATFGTDTVCLRARPDWTERPYGATCCR